MILKMITQAKTLAQSVHFAQKRANGDPYYTHVDLVYRIVRYWMQNNTVLYILQYEETLVAALLHDAVEDHPNKLSIEMVGQQFGVMVAQIIQKLNNNNFNNYLDYLLSLQESDSKDISQIVLLIKMADIIANYYDVLHNPGKNKHQMKHLKNKAELSFYILFHQKIWERAELKLIRENII